MKLIYLYHSGFALLGEGYTIIFDYFEDSAFPVTVMRIILIKRY